MTIPNVTTSVDDDTFIVDLNAELNADHITVFFDFDGLINAIGTTGERNDGILTVSNLQEWSNRLSNDEPTGITQSAFERDVSTLYSYDFVLKQPFLSKQLNVPFAQESYNYAKSYLPRLNGYSQLNDQESSTTVINDQQLGNINPLSLAFDARRLNYSNVPVSGLNSSIFYALNNNNYAEIFSNFNPSADLDDVLGNSFNTLGLTFGNHLANKNIPRWPFGPVNGWDTLWWSVSNFIEYGGNAIIVAPDIQGVTASKVDSVTNKLLSNNLSFDTITCLNGLDNEIARNIANQRRDCIAITTLAAGAIIGDETDTGGVTLPPGITNKPEGTSGGAFRFSIVNAWLTGGAFGVNGVSSDIKYWENNNAVNNMSYPSGVGNYNPNSGGVTLSTDYGLGTGDMHLATTMIPFADYPIRSVYYDRNLISWDEYRGPGIDGSHVGNTVLGPLFEDWGFLGTYLLQGATTELISGPLAADLPTQKIIVRSSSPNKQRSSADFKLGDLFYPAGDLKFFGASGTTFSERLLGIMGNTESGFLFRKIVKGICGSTGMNGGVRGSDGSLNSEGTGYLGGARSVAGQYAAADSISQIRYAFDASEFDNDDTNTVHSMSFNGKTDCPNLNYNDRNTPFTPFFMDVRKTFQKAKEQYNLTGLNRPSKVEDLIFNPSDSKSIPSYNTSNSILKQFPSWNQASLGAFFYPANGQGFPLPTSEYGTEFDVALHEVHFSVNGWPSNRYDSGEGFYNATGRPVPTQYFVPPEHKNDYAAYSVEQNFLEYKKRSAALLWGIDIYGSTLSNESGKPGYEIHSQRDNGLHRFWGCTCAQLPDFFREVLEVGRTSGGIPVSSQQSNVVNREQFNESGYTPIRCIEFGPNETTAQVTAEGSTYCAFVGFEDRFQELYLDYRDTSGRMMGGTAQEFPCNLAAGPSSTSLRTTDVVGRSIDWLTGATKDTHPGYARGGTFANMYLPYRANEQVWPNIRVPYIYVGGAGYGFNLVPYLYINPTTGESFEDYPTGMSIVFESLPGDD